jgi:hypothetical protein
VLDGLHPLNINDVATTMTFSAFAR